MIFAGAASKPPQDRDRFLAEACGTNETLRQKIRDALPAIESSTAVLPAEIAGYRVICELGRGAMGLVYLASDPTLDRNVALKRIHLATANKEEAAERFLREMRAVAKLSHSNIVTAHHAIEYEGDQILVMEYVPGVDLATAIKANGQAAPELAIDWIIQAARGLQHAHEAGIVHRDVKPANLLLHENGTVKILDLGLARTDLVDPDRSSLTMSGIVMGTVDFMAPEQANEAREADHRADIYSLGCTLYFFLTGTSVFEGETLYKKIEAHVREPAPKLEGVPKMLDTAFQRMLAKNPEDRQQSMAEVVAELEEVQHRTDWNFFGDRPAGPKEKETHSVRRFRPMLVLLIAAAVAMLFYLLRDDNPQPVVPTPTDQLGLPLIPPPTAGSSHLVDSGQRLDRFWAMGAAAGDLDGDGDLDVIVSNYRHAPSRVWLNDGHGRFSPGAGIEARDHSNVALGDFDHDGDLDAAFGDYGDNWRTWRNDGKAGFSTWLQFDSPLCKDLALDDVNGDGHLDAVFAHGYAGDPSPNTVWLGDGDGNFRQTGQQLGSESTFGVALGDLDGDGDPDIVFANGGEHGGPLLLPNTVWFNQGGGVFEDSGQRLGNAPSRRIALGDLDGDSDLDMVVANSFGESSEVWENDGGGRFSIIEQSLGKGMEHQPLLGDFDLDGDLDLVLTGTAGNFAFRWLNNGAGRFSQPVQLGRNERGASSVAAGDFDADGDWDLFVASNGPNEIWLNESPRANGDDGLLIDDEFDDGDLSTNAGVGNGFTDTSEGGGVASESNGIATLSKFGSGGARAIMRSIDSFDAVEGVVATFDIQAASSGLEDGFAGERRTVVGLTNNPAHIGLNIDANHSLYVTLAGDFDGGLPTSGRQGNLIWVDSERNRTNLASWDWVTFSGKNASLDLQVTLTIEADAYELGFSGTDAGIRNLEGSLSGVLENNALSAAYAWAWEQRDSTGDGVSSFAIDRIIVRRKR